LVFITVTFKGGNESDLRTKTKMTFRKRDESITDLNLALYYIFVINEISISSMSYGL
jgi:hypothetical protein